MLVSKPTLCLAFVTSYLPTGQRILVLILLSPLLISLLISSFLLDSGWAGTEDFGSYVFVPLSTCLFTRAWTGSFTLGNPGICSALRRSCLAQTLFESQLAQKQAVWKFSEIFVCKVTLLLAAYCCIICLHWCFGFEAAWQCACWNELANLSMLS